jgi:DNA polymerase (family 10)
MARAAKKLGYTYLAITEHSQRATVTKGLAAKRLASQIEQIDKLNDKLHGIRLLKGIEVDILAEWPRRSV